MFRIPGQVPGRPGPRQGVGGEGPRNRNHHEARRGSSHRQRETHTGASAASAASGPLPHPALTLASMPLCPQTNHPHVIFAAQKGGGKHGCANGVEVDYTNRGRARRQRHVASGAGGVRPTFGTLLDDMVLPADFNRDLLKSFVEVDRGDDDAEDDDEDDEDDDLDDEADVVDGKASGRVAEDADAAPAEVEVRRKSRAAEPSPPAAPGREGERGKGGRGKARKAGKDAGKDAKDAGKKRRRKRKRLKRNIQGMTKFIELALVLDKAMVSKVGMPASASGQASPGIEPALTQPDSALTVQPAAQLHAGGHRPRRLADRQHR